MEILSFHMYDLPWLVDLIFYCQYDYNPCQCFNNRSGITDSFSQHSQLMTHKKSRRQYIYQWKANYSLYRILIFIDWNNASKNYLQYVKLQIRKKKPSEGFFWQTCGKGLKTLTEMYWLTFIAIKMICNIIYKMVLHIYTCFFS